MERMLVAAGFLADTPELQEDLTDPDNCHCVYVGGNKEYSESERLRVEREITQRTAGRAGGAP